MKPIDWNKPIKRSEGPEEELTVLDTDVRQGMYDGDPDAPGSQPHVLVKSRAPGRIDWLYRYMQNGKPATPTSPELVNA